MCIRDRLKDKLGVDEDISLILVREGYSRISDIAHAEIEDLVSIEEFDIDIANAIISRSKDVLLQDILNEDIIEIPEEFSTMEFLSEEIAHNLVTNGVDSKEKLADMSIDDLKDIVSIDDDSAGKLIMEARKDWFKD